MIEVRRISKWYGRVRALNDVSFDAGRGQVVGLLGPNGAGKTTTIRITTGFLPPSEGSVTVCGHDSVDDSAAARRSIGYLPESAPFYPEMAVEAYLTYRAKLYGLARAARRRGIEYAMERCLLGEVRSRRIGQLSKGFRQRVGLAAALLHDPPVLVLDEPTAGLDPAQIRESRRLVRDLAEKHTVLVSSHILPEVEQTCDRVVIIARGTIRADGAPQQLLESLASQTRYRITLVGTGEGSIERGLAAVRAIGGVSRVLECEQHHAGAGDRCAASLTVEPAAGAGDLLDALSGAAGAGGCRVRELYRVRPTLENLFMQVIENDGPPAERPRAPGEAGPAATGVEG